MIKLEDFTVTSWGPANKYKYIFYKADNSDNMWIPKTYLAKYAAKRETNYNGTYWIIDKDLYGSRNGIYTYNGVWSNKALKSFVDVLVSTHIIHKDVLDNIFQGKK